jgi:hypothetical protein
MRLQQYILNELSSEFGKGISFLDLDETLYRTFSKIYVMKNSKVFKKLSNQEFNTYKLQPDETFDFSEFGDAEFFNKTSKPIIPTINRVKRMFKNIERRDSQIVILTARQEFKNMNVFKKIFREHGIPIDNITIEFRKNANKSVSAEKKHTILKYLSTGEYRRCRLIDDDITNIRKFLEIENTLSQDIIDKVKKRYSIPEDETFPVISFYGLLVLPDGKLKEIRGEE